MPHTFAPIQSEAEINDASSIISLAFAGTVDGCRDWIVKNVGLPNFRAVKIDGNVVATGVRVPMAQFFGGRPVPMTGIAGIAVAPHARGKGVGRTLMRELITEIHREGTAISTLYPATTTLYRRMGYEQAGQHIEHRFPATRFPSRKAPLSARPYTTADFEAVKKCYSRHAIHQDGALDRGLYIWDRVLEPRTTAATGYVIEEPSVDGGISGYLFFTQQRPEGFGRHEVHVSDMVANTPAAAASLLSFLGEFGSMAEDVVFRAGVIHPLFSLIDEPRYLRLEFKDYWMLRITNTQAALTARGYPAGLSQRLELDVTDDLIAENSGRFTLTVEAGIPTVTRGGSGSLRTGIQGLAQLFSGQFSPHALAAIGRIQGSAADLSSARALFASHGGVGFCDFF